MSYRLCCFCYEWRDFVLLGTAIVYVQSDSIQSSFSLPQLGICDQWKHNKALVSSIVSSLIFTNRIGSKKIKIKNKKIKSCYICCFVFLLAEKETFLYFYSIARLLLIQFYSFDTWKKKKKKNKNKNKKKMSKRNRKQRSIVFFFSFELIKKIKMWMKRKFVD